MNYLDSAAYDYQLVQYPYGCLRLAALVIQVVVALVVEVDL